MPTPLPKNTMNSKSEAPPVEAAAAQDITSGLVPFVQTIRKHWPVVVAAVIFAAGASLAYSKSQSRIYQATALIEFDLRAIRPLADKQADMRGEDAYWDNREYYETQLKIVTSDRVLTRVVRDLALQNDLNFL